MREHAPEPARRNRDHQLDGGTHEVLRGRLSGQAAELARRAEALNARRLEVFGGTELRLAGAERIRTDNNCVPRDIVPVAGSLMLFGYNVFVGLRPETTVDDVFSLHRFVREGEAFRFEHVPSDEVPGLLHDPRFRKDFADLYRYYRDTRLMQLRRLDGKLLAVFQTGARTTDIRVLRWQIAPDGAVGYLDARGDRDHVFPSSHDFQWLETTREQHVLGRHPHVSIDGEVFVETVGGDLTIKIENNTETGEGIYGEPVDEPLQSLADADIHYARIGSLILLRVRPYNETDRRHLVFNTRTKDVLRLDGIGQSCRRLPEDHGLIFPGGYYLTTGAARTFDTEVAGLEFERVIRSANGEDVLYVFRARAEGRTLLLPYNVIRKEVAAPLVCHGHSLFDDGTLVVFRAVSEEPTRVHPMQVWLTPFLSDAHAAAQPVGTGALERVGNAELVRGISDCLSVSRMVGEMTPSTAVYEGLISACSRVFDHYHWLGEPELGDLRAPLGAVRSAAEQVLEEFEKVEALTAQAAAAVDEAAAKITSLVRLVRGEAPPTAGGWVERLAELRREQGHLVTLRELRHVDTARLDRLTSSLAAELQHAGRRAVGFLQGEDAFAGYHERVERLVTEASGITTVAEAVPLGESLAEQTGRLETVTEVVGSLDIADATVRTRILERIGEVLGGVNRARATLEARRRQLLAVEGRAAFAAEFALLNQAVTGALAVADTPERCDERLGRLMLQLENLETRFGDFDDFLAELAAKREDVYEAFASRKQTLLDERARRADRLAASAERTLAGVRRRIANLSSLDEINTYFAADPMVAKLRQVAEDLRALGDAVRAEELGGHLKAARQEAGRALRDRADLFSDGGETIRLGRHRFAVNTQPTDLTLVPHEGGMAYAITGTDYRAPLRDPDFEATREFWDQLVVSESPSVYRAEYLATSILAKVDLKSPPAADSLLTVVRQVAESRYDEGYERGVHDHDAALILDALLRLHSAAGMLRYPPAARAAAQLFWTNGTAEHDRSLWSRRAASLARARSAFGSSPAIDELSAELADAVAVFMTRIGFDGTPKQRDASAPDGAGHAVRPSGAGSTPGFGEALRSNLALCGEYLFEELACSPAGFVTGAAARGLLDRFRRALDEKSRRAFEDDQRALSDDLAARHQLVEAWLRAFLESRDSGPVMDLDEAIAIELCGDGVTRYDSSATLEFTVEGLLGTHPRITERRLTLRLDELLARTRAFGEERVPAYRAYQRRRAELVEKERERLRLEEYRPKVMSAFVRNRLLDEVYLPLIGDNLAKQLGASGDAKRTDQMGLLLLISPPGYGKTTLLEYLASRLGLLFVKVNGPALGHSITSLDPAEAPNATARQEIEKVSFALECGNNTLLYLDDIQHTSPELLQKFISLCDAQRRMEGVWNGRTRTYDLRGKRFAVCMAGNPYTEAGKKFRIPDMLANRADVWNLGDVLSGKEDLFALSYIENALTSNSVLAPLSTRDRKDIELLVRLAGGDDSVRPDGLSHPYSQVELEQMTSVLGKLLRVQQIILAVNHAYIASAAQSDASRTEPPFQLQGSYRNMNKLAERIVPVMNDEELQALIEDHYLGESQTLASGAEANLLKLAELRGTRTESQSKRWHEIKNSYLRAKALGTEEDNPITRAVGAIGLLADRVGDISQAIDQAGNRGQAAQVTDADQ